MKKNAPVTYVSLLSEQNARNLMLTVNVGEKVVFNNSYCSNN